MNSIMLMFVTCGVNANCAQKSKLFDNRRPILLSRKGWCFVTRHLKCSNLTYLEEIHEGFYEGNFVRQIIVQNIL
jgi:hypothetical protein